MIDSEVARKAVIEECAKKCDEFERRYLNEAATALHEGKVLMGHRQLVAAAIAAAIRELKYETS